MRNGLKRAQDTARATHRTPPHRKITEAKARRLVVAIAALQECSDCTPDLSQALEDARAAISPWYDQ